jgi:hypothetical protein
MNRRGFLAILGITVAGAAAGVAIPELWTPKRTFFLPPKGGWIPQGWNPYTYQWTWLRGGSGIMIDDPTGNATTFSPDPHGWPSRSLSASDKAVCIVTDSSGRQVRSPIFNVEFVRADESVIFKA